MITFYHLQDYILSWCLCTSFKKIHNDVNKYAYIFNYSFTFVVYQFIEFYSVYISSIVWFYIPFSLLFENFTLHDIVVFVANIALHSGKSLSFAGMLLLLPTSTGIGGF